MTDIDEILEGTQPDVATEPTTEEKTADQPRDEQGRFTKGEAQEDKPVEGAPPAPEDQKDDHKAEQPKLVPNAALLDERRKRQELERELAEIKKRAVQSDPPPIPDVLEDQKGYSDHVTQAAVQSAVMVARAEASRSYNRKQHQDFDEVMQAYYELEAQNPAIAHRVIQSEDPFGEAYRVAKDHIRMKDYGSIDEMLAAERKKWEAETLATQKVQTPAPQLPPSLAGVRSTAPRSGPDWSGPTPLSDLIN